MDLPVARFLNEADKERAWAEPPVAPVAMGVKDICMEREGSKVGGGLDGAVRTKLL